MRHHPNKRTFVLATSGPYANRGCEAIVRGTTALLREQVGDCRFISNYDPGEGCRDAERETDPDIIHCPFPYLKRYSLPWIEEQITRKVFRQPENVVRVSRTFRRSLTDAEGVLMLGGDTYSLDYHRPYILFKLHDIALDRKLPVAIWGASVGPFSSNPEFERLAAKELSKVSLICARETETQAYLASIGVERNVILAADPAFFLEPATCDLPASIEKVLTEGCIGLNLSPLLHRFMQRDECAAFGQQSFPAWTHIAAEIVHSLFRRFSQPILLIPHVILEVGNIHRDDYLFLSWVAQLVQEPERVYVLGPSFTAAQTKWVIGRTRVFAGARTHSTLAAISSGVPTICIAYSMKARGIAKDVYGNLEWLVETKDLVKDPSLLCERLVSLSDQESELRSQLKLMNPIFRQRAREATKRFIDVVEEGRSSPDMTGG